LQRAVEMAHVLLEGVVGRQVHAAAEPPHRILAFGQRDEAAHVQVHGGAIRIARMQYQRHAHGLEAAAGQLGAMRSRRGGHALTHHVREVHPAALEEVAVLDHPGEAAAAARAFPAVGAEGLAVEGLEALDDAVLQVGEPGFDDAWIHAGSSEALARKRHARSVRAGVCCGMKREAVPRGCGDGGGGA
jgi:hypothetical protein